MVFMIDFISTSIVLDFLFKLSDAIS